MLEFDELRIRLRGIGTERYLALANGPATAATVLRIGDEPAALRAEFNELIDIELGRAPGRTDVANRLRVLGRSVFALLFDDKLKECLHAAQSRQPSNGLRLRFDLPSELHDLPIEALCWPSEDSGQTFALNATLSLARSLPGDPAGHRLPTAADNAVRIQLLVAIASPSGWSPTESEVELSALRATLPEMNIEPVRATRESIKSWLNQNADKPAVVLLIAHGTYSEETREGIIVLEAEDHTPDHVPGHLLSGILVGAKQLRLVVLNLCSGASTTRVEPYSGLAQALIGRGIPAVVAMSGMVTDLAANTFGPVLLDGICSNKTVDEAMTAARQHIANLPGHTTIEWATPTLFLHRTYGDGWLFKAPEVHEEGDETTDPLRAGEDALRRLEAPGSVKIATVLAAARFLRRKYDWHGVLDKVRTRRLNPEQLLMITEARIELAWPVIEQACAMLANEHDPDAVEHGLTGVGELVPEALTNEIKEVRELAGLVATARQAEVDQNWADTVRCYEAILAARPAGFRDLSARLAAARNEVALGDLYASAEAHRAEGRWPDALAEYTEIVALCPDGYQAAGAWTAYATGRVAEERLCWNEAAVAYTECAEFEDARARLAYAHGQLAAGAEDWAEAHRHFLAAQQCGLVPDDWCGYTAAKLAEAAQQWSVAGEGYRRLAGFLDAEERSLLMFGWLAIESDDLAAAAAAFEKLVAAGWDLVNDLADVRLHQYQEAVAAENAQHWPAAAAGYESLPAGYADVLARKAYVDARVAEEVADWTIAADGYRTTDHADAALRLGYALGQLAEAASTWVEAYQQYSALPQNLLDAGARARYAAGRSADDRDDWALVIAGFGELPDDFAGGEVGRRRRFARAKLADERADWRSVLALLGDALDEERDGNVGLLRCTARGGLAEDDDDWASAVSIYAPAVERSPDILRAHHYATGRLSEKDDNWAAALEAYAKLPADHRDLPVRGAYTRARLIEQEAVDWAAVIAAYAAVPADFEDVSTRLAYARLMLAMVKENWTDALGLAGVLGNYPETTMLLSYARGREAEHREDWSEAVTSYRACTGYADSTARQSYATGRELEEAGQWSAAIAAYRQPRTPMPGSGERSDRLARLLAALPWADGLANVALVADPVALRDETFPYLALHAVAVTPASPTELVQNAAYLLMERGGMSWQERVAWEQLRTPAKRLRVDARLYRFHDPAALGRELNALEPASRPVLLSQLCTHLPQDAALITLLDGNRTDAIAGWRHRLAEAPGDMTAVHGMAVGSFWHAQELEDTGAWEQAEQVWRTALACWAVLLTDDEHWVGWRQARAACYGHAVTPAETSRLRAELGRYLIDLLTGHAERHAGAGRPQQGERYRDLVSFLEAELEAAQSLKEAGGLTMSGEPGGTLASGPEYLRIAGRTKEFGEFVARADPPRIGDEESSGAILRRLRWSFSELSTAFSAIEHHRFELALRVLPEVHLRRQVDLLADCSGPDADEHGKIDDCPHCQDFLARNPAYVYLPRRLARLSQDAVGLAVRAHLSIARGLLATSGHLDRAMTELAAAITVSANATMTVRTRQAVLRMVLGRVDALTETSRQQIHRLDAAVVLVERALPVVGAPGRDTLTLALADLLIDRGVWTGSTCREHGIRPDIARAVADLRRALELNPESARARDNLARALISLQEDLNRADVGGRLATLLDALTLVHSGLERAAVSNLLRECLGDVLGEVETLLLANLSIEELGKLAVGAGDLPPDYKERARVLADRAERHRKDGDLTGCARDLVRATRADPADPAMRTGLLAALGALLEKLRQEGSRGL